MPVLHGKVGEFHESIYGQVRQIFYQEMIYPPLQKRRLPQAATMRSAKKKKQKVDKDLLLRKEALEQLKSKIATTKKAIKVSETAKKVEEAKAK